MDTYSQTLSLRFRSGASARRARLRIAPLFHDFRAALSTRMDDNNTNALRVLKVMRRHGQAGTFFLNDPRRWWQDGQRRGSPRPADPGSLVPSSILAAGGSIGAHTLSHDHLPALSKNAAFREILGSRVALEAATSSPVSTFTFPFVFYESELREGRDRADFDEILRRSGFLLLGENAYNSRRATGLLDAVFIGCDGGRWEGRSDDDVVARHFRPGLRPLFLVTMHAWARSWGGREFPLLAQVYRKWAGRGDWWYCNQNQYAAYRWQALRSRVEVTVEGDLMTATLVRPDPLDLMDPVPLTLVVGGIEDAEVASAACAGAAVTRLSIGGRCALDVFHPADRGPVDVFGECANDANARRLPRACPGTGGLKALLFRAGRTLTLELHNAGAAPVTDLRVLFRLPLRWNPGVIRRSLKRLGAGRSATLKAALTGRPRTGWRTVGTEYHVAQVDFVGKVRARLYATCCVPGPAPGAGFARDGFRFMGPLADGADRGDPFRIPGIGAASPDGALAWRTLDPARAALLDPDIIPITGRPRAADFADSHPSPRNPGARHRYLILGYARSRSNQLVRAVYPGEYVKRLELNGRLIRGRALALKRGANEIRILYSPPRASEALFSEHHYGCYFRLADAAGNRVRGLRFSRSP
jgi:peptidoglycan/xylan/chitin deacetylase (PgdA/CDA1 family)